MYVEAAVMFSIAVRMHKTFQTRNFQKYDLPNLVFLDVSSHLENKENIGVVSHLNAVTQIEK